MSLRTQVGFTLNNIFYDKKLSTLNTFFTLVDAIIIRGIDADLLNRYVKKLFKEIIQIDTLSCASPTNLDNPLCITLPMTEVETYPTSSSASSPLSISRCGEMFLPFMFHSLKHSKATPNSLNDCTGSRLSLSEDPVVQLQSFIYSESKIRLGSFEVQVQNDYLFFRCITW